MSAALQDEAAHARGNPLGIYEKALPKALSWMARLSLAQALGFDFVEMSVDETDERLARLDWSAAERASLRAAIAESGVTVPSMCLSGHRRFPFGSRDPAIRSRAREIMRQAIDLSVSIGLRTIQLAGYDVYYEPSDEGTRQRFIEGLRWAVDEAARSQVMLAVEIMDTPFINSITAWLEYAEMIESPFFCVYPDLGNLSAWNNDVPAELRKGAAKIVAIHLKDTLRVTVDFPGQFRDVPFGTGCVDFPACFRTLAELRYRGPFVIEMWTEKAAEPVVEIAQARRWLLEQMRCGGMSPGEDGRSPAS
jgi:hexulose-6-phosphate isomerase